MQTRLSPSRQYLNSLAHAAGMRDFENMGKPVLFKRLRDHIDLDREERRMKIARKNGAASAGAAGSGSGSGSGASSRRRKGKKRSKKKRSSSALHPNFQPPTNNNCPITRAPLGKNRFLFIRPNGASVWYDVRALHEYVLASGDFAEPETRIPFQLKDLKALDSQARAAGIVDGSCVELFRNPELLRHQREARDAAFGLERACGEHVVEMMDVIESSEREEGEMRLCLSILPNFEHMFSQFVQVDPEGARQNMKSFIDYLIGPPNRRTRDPEGFLSIILNFLRSL